MNPFAGEFVLTATYLRELRAARLAGTEPGHLPDLAPARTSHLAGLTPAVIAVRSLDLVVDDALNYAAKLGGAGVPVELHVYPGVDHGFDLVPGSATDRFNDDLAHAIEALLT